jgi:hypothetical protein
MVDPDDLADHLEVVPADGWPCDAAIEALARLLLDASEAEVPPQSEPAEMSA